jgi:hypothetical protein
MDAFWCSPTFDEAAAWGAYPYDSDPAGTSIRQLARPFDDTSQTDLAGVRGDRAWIHGSAALTRHPANLPPDLLEGGPAADKPSCSGNPASLFRGRSGVQCAVHDCHTR